MLRQGALRPFLAFDLQLLFDSRIQEKRASCSYAIGHDATDSKISELDIEVHEDEFPYWRKYDAKRKPK